MCPALREPLRVIAGWAARLFAFAFQAGHAIHCNRVFQEGPRGLETVKLCVKTPKTPAQILRLGCHHQRRQPARGGAWRRSGIWTPIPEFWVFVSERPVYE